MTSPGDISTLNTAKHSSSRPPSRAHTFSRVHLLSFPLIHASGRCSSPAAAQCRGTGRGAGLITRRRCWWVIGHRRFDNKVDVARELAMTGPRLGSQSLTAMPPPTTFSPRHPTLHARTMTGAVVMVVVMVAIVSNAVVIAVLVLGHGRGRSTRRWKHHGRD